MYAITENFRAALEIPMAVTGDRGARECSAQVGGHIEQNGSESSGSVKPSKTPDPFGRF